MANKTKILNQAQKFITKGQWDKAIRELQKLIAEDPKDVRTLLKLGDVYSKQGDRESATRVYRQVAESYGEQGFFLKAVAVYKQILKHDPQHLEVTVRLAELYEKLSLSSEAETQYHHAVKLHEQRGEGKKALQLLEKIVEMKSDHENIPARIKLAEAFSRESMLAEAAAQFERAAQSLKEQGRIDDYIKVAERLAYHDPSRIDVLKDIAKILLGKSETKRALAKLQVIYKEHKKDIETLHLLARAFMDLGQSQKTIYVYRELAHLHQDQGRPVDAATVYQQILQLDPNDPEARQALGYGPGGAPTAAVPSGPLSFGSGRVPPNGPPPAPEMAPAPPPTPEPGPQGPSLSPRPGPRGPSAAPPPPPPLDPSADEDLVMSDGPAPPLAPRLSPRPAPPARAGSVPMAPAASSAQPQSSPNSPQERIQKILTETDVFIRYGLRDKALEHLRSVFALDPDNVAAFEKIRDVHLGTGARDRAAEALANIIQICARRGDKEGIDRYQRELAELQPEHPLAAGVLNDPAAAGPPEQAPEPDSISIDISEESGMYDARSEPGEGSSFDVAIGEVDLGEEPDPFAGAVMEEEEPAELDPFAIQEGADGPDFTAFGAPSEPDFGASSPDHARAEIDLEAFDGGGEAEQIPSGVFDVLAPDATGEVPALGADGPSGEGVVLLEEIEGADEGWPPGLQLPSGASADEPPLEARTDDALQWDQALAEVPEPGPPPPVERAAEQPVDLDWDAERAETGEMAEPSEAELDVSAAAVGPTTMPTAALEPLADEAEDDDEISDELEEVEFMLDTGLPDEARDMLRGILERAPTSPRARALWARAEAEAGDDAEAEEAPAPPAPAAASEERGPETRDVADDVLRMLDEGQDEPASEDRFDQGMMYRDLGMYDDAIREFRAAARSESRALDSLEMIGHCLVAKSEIKAGIECFRLALSRGADGAAATNLKFEIGAAYERLHDLSRAARWYRACSDDDPNHREVSIRLAAVEAASKANGATGPDNGGPRSSRKNKISYL